MIRTRRFKTSLFKRILLLLVISLIIYAYIGSDRFVLASRSQISATEGLSSKISSAYFPTNGWRTSSPEAQNLNSTKLNAMCDNIAESDIGVDSIAIVRNGFLVYEKVFEYYNYSPMHHLFSSTKSITSILIGIANQTGYITNLDQPVLEIFSDRNFTNMDSRKQSMTIRHLLKMESGLEWNEDPITNSSVDKHDYALLSNHTNFYFDNWPICLESKAVQMVLLNTDWVQFILDQPMRDEPGTRFEYSTGVAHLLSAIIQNKTGMKAADFAKLTLFDPLNISNYYWWTDPMGITTGGHGLWMTPLDMLKIGYLYLNNGTWNNRQIVPKEWVQESTEPYNLGLRLNNNDWWYGYLWWVDNYTNTMQTGGFGGQFIFIKPDENLVVSITASEHGFEESVSYFFYHFILTSITHPIQASPGLTGIEIIIIVVILVSLFRYNKSKNRS
ncbi:MAG: serine hydrolase domain-containing protein [Candidatus Hodarchaeota archaeon]